MTLEELETLSEGGSWAAFKCKIVKDDLDVTYTLIDREEHQLRGDKLKLTEVYAESIHGRSYNGFGTIHELYYQDLEVMYMEILTSQELENLETERYR